MRKKVAQTALLLTIVPAMSGCFWFQAYDERIDGPYRLVATDVMEDMSVCYDLGTGSCVGRVNETVFAVGWNFEYIVAARHPREFAHELDKSETEYFYVIRALDGAAVAPSAAVRGPFAAADFQAEQQRLGLPRLSEVIDGLE